MQMRNIALTTLLVLSLAHSASAETISFSGRVDTVPEPLQSQIQPDMTISGFYTYDESVAVSDFIGSVTDFQMVIGDYSVGQDPTSVNGDISLKPREYTVVSVASGQPIGEYSPLLMALQLTSSSDIVDTSSPIPPPIEGFDNPLWTLDFSSGGLPLRVEGTIQSLAIPEPTGMLLAVVGSVVGLLACRRRGERNYSRNPNRR